MGPNWKHLQRFPKLYLAMKKIINCQNKLLFLSFHDNINLPCISEAAAGLIMLHVTVHQKDRNQDQCGRPRRQKAQSLHSFNALWSITINPIRKLSNLLETLGNTSCCTSLKIFNSICNFIFYAQNSNGSNLSIHFSQLTDFSSLASYVIPTAKQVLFVPKNFRMEFSLLVHCVNVGDPLHNSFFLSWCLSRCQRSKASASHKSTRTIPAKNK